MYDRPPASDDAEVEELLREGLGDVAARKVIESLELAARAYSVAPPS